ncbi:amidase [Candidatus Neomarinimicrobiota bacterium]
MRQNKLLAICLLVLFGLMGCSPQKEKVQIDLAELTISDIHEAYQEGRYSSEELVSAYLTVIKQHDEELNAVTVINKHALPIAIALDEEYKEAGVLRPLHGIPVIIKDNFNTKGLPTTAGALALQDFVPDADAFIVDKLVKAGAIIIAKSNMAEWAFSPMHTESSTAGTTRNPYNTEYVPAGSSGGTAAAVAANFVTIGLGTDTGNSIRGPSSHCALVGFRSTLGLTSRSGIVPLYLRNDVAGPLCRTVEDATRVLEIIAGYDPEDVLTEYSAGKIPDSYQQYLQEDGLVGARIGVLRELSEDNPDDDVKALFEAAIHDMARLGAGIVDPVEIPGFSELRENQWCDDFRQDVEAYLDTYVKRDTMKTLEDIIRVGTTSGYAEETLQYFGEHSGREEHPEIECLDPYTDVRRIAFRVAIETVMDELNLDAVVYPTWNNIPAELDSFMVEYKGDNNQIIAPHTGQPAFTVPMGYSAGNLPAGVQFLGRMFAEPTLIRLAYSYEQGTKHRRPPSVN